MNTKYHDRETVFQISVAMAALWALCWLFLQWDVPASWFPPVTNAELQTARQNIKP